MMHIFGISTWAHINMDFIVFNAWNLLPLKPMVPQQITNLTLL
jgi:hypothetical protein